MRAVATFAAYLISLAAIAAIHHFILGTGWSVDDEFCPLIVAILTATDKYWSQP